VIWLDPPKRVVMRQITSRTLKRGAKRQELGNGNRESLWSLTKWDPEENGTRWSHLAIIHLRTRNEAAEFLADLDE
jgi:hypothetical protein